MKKLFLIFIGVFICVILVVCFKRNSEENIISTDDIADGERLNAIFYNGECYYGLAMAQEIREGEEPEGFTYLGKISSIVEDYQSPTEELSATIGDIGDDVYHYTDEDGLHYFCTPIRLNYYRGIFLATIEKPDYYDQ